MLKSRSSFLGGGEVVGDALLKQQKLLLLNGAAYTLENPIAVMVASRTRFGLGSCSSSAATLPSLKEGPPASTQAQQHQQQQHQQQQLLLLVHLRAWRIFSRAFDCRGWCFSSFLPQQQQQQQQQQQRVAAAFLLTHVLYAAAALRWLRAAAAGWQRLSSEQRQRFAPFERYDWHQLSTPRVLLGAFFLAPVSCSNSESSKSSSGSSKSSSSDDVTGNGSNSSSSSSSSRKRAPFAALFHFCCSIFLKVFGQPACMQPRAL
ncbi:hypothetical protein Esti_001473 [Eimeria stiedai]